MWIFRSSDSPVKRSQGRGQEEEDPLDLHKLLPFIKSAPSSLEGTLSRHEERAPYQPPLLGVNPPMAGFAEQVKGDGPGGLITIKSSAWAFERSDMIGTGLNTTLFPAFFVSRTSKPIASYPGSDQKTHMCHICPDDIWSTEIWSGGQGGAQPSPVEEPESEWRHGPLWAPCRPERLHSLQSGEANWLFLAPPLRWSTCPAHQHPMLSLNSTPWLTFISPSTFALP